MSNNIKNSTNLVRTNNANGPEEIHVYLMLGIFYAHRQEPRNGNSFNTY